MALRFLPLSLVFFMAACQANQPEPEAAVPAVPANSPEGLLQRIYTLPVPNFTAFHDPAERDEFYTRSTSELISEAERCVADSPGLPHLEFDFIVPGDDFQLAELEISLQDQGDIRASVLVSFLNGGKPQRLFYELQRQQGQWLIHDVHFQESSLRGELQAACGSG